MQGARFFAVSLAAAMVGFVLLESSCAPACRRSRARCSPWRWSCRSPSSATSTGRSASRRRIQNEHAPSETDSGEGARRPRRPARARRAAGRSRAPTSRQRQAIAIASSSPRAARSCSRITMRASPCAGRGRTGSCSRARRSRTRRSRAGSSTARAAQVRGHSPVEAIRRLEDTSAIRIALRDPKAADWLKRYKAHTQYATYDSTLHLWTVHVNAGEPYGEVAQVEVDDRTGTVTHAWTGPQVDWGMARGYKGWFGRKLNDTRLWLAFCAVFLIALVDWRRILTLRTLDLVALLALLGLALVLRARPRVLGGAAAVPADGLPDRAPGLDRPARRAAAGQHGPPAVLGAGRAAGVPDRLPPRPERVRRDGHRRRLCGHRRRRPGAARPVALRQLPGRERRALRRPHSDGTSSAYRQAKEGGRCESPVATATPTGPSTTRPTCRRVAVTGWTGRWDDLPASHGTSAIFDLACVGGHGGRRLALRPPAARRCCAASRGSRIRSRATRCRRTRTT